MPTPEDERERASWLRTLYQTAHSDTRWAKEQGWRVVNWTLLLFGALLGIAKYPLQNISSTIFAVVDAVVLLVAITYLVELHLSAVGTRKTTAKIEDQIADLLTFLERRTHDINHHFYLGVQLFVVVFAFVLMVAAHLH